MVQVMARMLLLAGGYTLLVASQAVALDNICEAGGTAGGEARNADRVTRRTFLRSESSCSVQR